MKNIIFILLNVICISVLGQDVHFSQFFAAPLLTNPANTGNYSGAFRVGANYRDQWGSVSIPYRTYDLYADVGIQPGKSKNKLGLGVIALSDQAGDGALTSNRGYLSAAYHLSLSKEADYKLSVGLSGGIIQRRVNYSLLTFDSQWNGYDFDTDLPNGEAAFIEDFTYADINIGALFTATPLSYLRYFAGVSVAHVNQPIESFYDSGNTLDMRTQITAGAFFPLSNRITMNPIGYVSLQSSAYEFTGGSNFAYALDGGETRKSWLLGVWYRYYDAAWLLLGFTSGNLSTSVSYDLNFSELTAASNAMGGLELAIVYTLNKNDKKDPLNCPAYE